MERVLPRARLIVERIPSAGETLRLSARESRHARALRLAGGEEVTLLDGSGARARGRLLRVDRGGALVAIEDVEAAPAAAAPLALAVAAVRLERLSWIAEKATELGVSRLTLVRSARTQSFRAREQVKDRLERVAREAAKQSNLAGWPAIEGPLGLEDVLAGAAESARLFVDFEGSEFPLELREPSVALVIGPEGGWTESERDLARAHGWSLAALPAGKLRAETAALAALVLARAALARGGVGNR